MLILPINPSGFSTFCDDIRDEVSGKKSLIGVYNGAMIFASPAPEVLTQLCILTTTRLDHDMLPKQIALKILFEDEDFVEQILTSMEADLPAWSNKEDIGSSFAKKDGASFFQWNSEARIANFLLTKNGRIKVRLYVDDDIFTLGSLLVNFQPQENIGVESSALKN